MAKQQRQYTAESVSRGHPDKIADQISDAILDAYLAIDPDAKVACETLITNKLIVVAGEISSSATIDVQKVIRTCLSSIYLKAEWDGTIIENFTKQSQELQNACHKGASDQCIVYGYACDDTKELMPLPIVTAHQIISALEHAKSDLNFLRADAKSQVSATYDDAMKPVSIDSVVISVQHLPDISQDDLNRHIVSRIMPILPKQFITKECRILVNPGGSFVAGGPAADTGVTGRKQIVDTYGSMARHGGGAFSGKDPSKIDRAAAYLARYIAKNVVAARLAQRCEVHMAYAIGIAEPIVFSINTYNSLDTNKLKKAIYSLFDLAGNRIQDTLNLKRPIFQKTACHGHFGRSDPDFTWEQLNKAQPLASIYNSRN